MSDDTLAQPEETHHAGEWAQPDPTAAPDGAEGAPAESETPAEDTPAEQPASDAPSDTEASEEEVG